MSIKHILYINNNRQLKWELCQGVLVTHCTEEYTPCAAKCLTSANETLVHGLASVDWLKKKKALMKAMAGKSQLELVCSRDRVLLDSMQVS